MKMNLKINSQALIEFSNLANEKVAKPAAEEIAARAGKGMEAQEYTRSGLPDWARYRVVATTPEAMLREVREGVLSKALR